MLLAIYDIETNGLLTEKREKNGSVCPPMNTVHGIGILLRDLADPTAPIRRISACKAYRKGQSGRGWERMPIEDALRILEQADIRVAHNGQDFDERALLLVYPWFSPKPSSRMLDTLILSRLIYPDIHRTGPNGHKLFPHERRQHGVYAWGKRLGEPKGDYTDWCKENGFEPWASWREEMQEYMEQDVEVLDKIFTWLWAQKPSTTAVTLEHEFAAIIRRMESRGVGFDSPKAEALLAQLTLKASALETDLIDTFGEWWEYGKAANARAAPDMRSSWKDAEEDEDEEDEDAQALRLRQFENTKDYGAVIIPPKTYRSKRLGFANVTRRRIGKSGKELAPYVGPSLIEITAGSAYTPIKRVQFNPASRQHIWKRLMAKYGWKPSKLTPGGKSGTPQPMIDEDVLRGLGTEH